MAVQEKISDSLPTEKNILCVKCLCKTAFRKPTLTEIRDFRPIYRATLDDRSKSFHHLWGPVPAARALRDHCGNKSLGDPAGAVRLPQSAGMSTLLQQVHCGNKSVIVTTNWRRASCPKLRLTTTTQTAPTAAATGQAKSIRASCRPLF